jgi:PsbP
VRRPLSRQRLALIGLAVVVILGGSVALGNSVISSPSTAPKGRATPAPSPKGSTRAIPARFVTFTDRQAGFSIAYPRGWKRLRPADAGVRLIAADGKRASLLVRIAPVGLDVTQDTLPAVRDLTQRLVTADRGVKRVSTPEQVSLDGLPGYRYVYTFTARDGTRGAHVHYFLFRNKRLISLVFQVPGVRAVKRDSVLLDRVAGTFRVVQ